MRVKEDFMLREIAGESIVIPINDAAANFQGIMSLNETGRFLWKMLKEECSEEMLITALLEEYDTTPETAKQDVAVFLDQLRGQNILIENADEYPQG